MAPAPAPGQPCKNNKVDLMVTNLIQLYNKIVLQKPILTLLVCAVVIVFFLANITRFELDASADSLILENDAALKYYRSVRENYGSDDFLIVTYSPQKPLFSPETLQARAPSPNETQLPNSRKVETPAAIAHPRLFHHKLNQVEFAELHPLPHCGPRSATNGENCLTVALFPSQRWSPQLFARPPAPDPEHPHPANPVDDQLDKSKTDRSTKTLPTPHGPLGPQFAAVVVHWSSIQSHFSSLLF